MKSNRKSEKSNRKSEKSNRKSEKSNRKSEKSNRKSEKSNRKSEKSNRKSEKSNRKSEKSNQKTRKSNQKSENSLTDRDQYIINKSIKFKQDLKKIDENWHGLSDSIKKYAAWIYKKIDEYVILNEKHQLYDHAKFSQLNIINGETIALVNKVEKLALRYEQTMKKMRDVFMASSWIYKDNQETTEIKTCEEELKEMEDLFIIYEPFIRQLQKNLKGAEAAFQKLLQHSKVLEN